MTLVRDAQEQDSRSMIKQFRLFVHLVSSPSNMQRYIITKQCGVDGLRLEKDVEVPQLKGPNDVSHPRSSQKHQTQTKSSDPNQYQSLVTQR